MNNRILAGYRLVLLLLFITPFVKAQEMKKNINARTLPGSFVTSKEILKDKLKGGWAGQTIGVTFGGPVEFLYNGTYIQDYQSLNWDNSRIARTMDSFAGLYDDIYMDLTFVEVYNRLGLDAPLDSFAQAFANAGYVLWHANQAGRYNIQNGLPSGKAGNWLHNPHADDIDFQIESDFAGLMSPGMPYAAAIICDSIGHLMNSGDGWYGGVFVAAMYAEAVMSDDVTHIVQQALKMIPARSKFYQCIADVIRWHAKYPDNWKQTWFEIQQKWAEDAGCPDGVFQPLDIDAKINAAYVVLGLLYGKGDFTRTMEITTRAGQDADCNPSTAGGILGTMLGYSKIPAYWRDAVTPAQDKIFKYTSTSLNTVYDTGFELALKNIVRHGGKVNGDKVQIPLKVSVPVHFEENFTGHYPKARVPFSHAGFIETSFAVPGIGFVLRGYARKKKESLQEYVFKIKVTIDGKDAETVSLPTDYNRRRTDICWKYQLPKGDHEVKLLILNPNPDYELVTVDYLLYEDTPVKGSR